MLTKRNTNDITFEAALSISRVRAKKPDVGQLNTDCCKITSHNASQDSFVCIQFSFPWRTCTKWVFNVSFSVFRNKIGLTFAKKGGFHDLKNTCICEFNFWFFYSINCVLIFQIVWHQEHYTLLTSFYITQHAYFYST